MTASRWADHLGQVLLPWWEAHGVDDEGGGVLTGFDNDGTLHTTDRFTWSQGRWAWLAGELTDEADAGRLDVDPSTWRRRCLATCDRLVRQSVRQDHRTHFRVTADGEGVPDEAGETATSVFADLFAVLGLAAGLRQLSDADPRLASWSATGTGILETARAAIEGGTATAEPYPVPAGFADLAGPMTLLHTAAELLRSPTTDPAAAQRVRDWAGERLTTTHFTGEGWWEFAPLRAGLEDTLLARHRTPGHLLELLWMIVHAQDADPGWQLLPRERLTTLARRAITMGWDDEHGGVLRYTDTDGGQPVGPLLGDSRYEQLVQRTWDTKLWWVHAESLYALTLLGDGDHDGDGDPVLADWADRVADWTMATFPAADGQEWIQIRDRKGAPLNEVVALPVKDPFHPIRAMILMNRLSIHREKGRP